MDPERWGLTGPGRLPKSEPMVISEVSSSSPFPNTQRDTQKGGTAHCPTTRYNDRTITAGLDLFAFAMAAKGPGPLKLASRALLTRRPPPALFQRRTFLDSVFQTRKPLTINVSRTLPYPREKLYDIIADVDAYSSFLPYCQHSRVTKWLKPQAGGEQRAWPTEGELTVGFGPVAQSYTSRIVCVPGRSIEALSGRQEGIPGPAGSPFESLVTKWTVHDAIVKRIGTWSTVDLDLTMRLADPLVHMMLSKVVDETANKMVDAFEQRARDLFGDSDA